MLKIGRSKWKFIIISIICMCLFFSIQAYASQPVEQSAHNAVEAFFNAILEKDFNAYVSNSVDTIPLSKRQQVFGIGNVLGYQIESIQKVDNEHVTAIVEVREKDLTLTMKYPVILDGEKWVIDLDNSENIAQYSNDGKKIFPFSRDSQNKPPYSSGGQTTVSPTTLAAQYGGSLGNGYNRVMDIICLFIRENFHPPITMSR